MKIGNISYQFTATTEVLKTELRWKFVNMLEISVDVLKIFNVLEQ